VVKRSFRSTIFGYMMLLDRHMSTIDWVCVWGCVGVGEVTMYMPHQFTVSDGVFYVPPPHA